MNAIVLAAGLGTRLRPLTNDRPKALVEVAGAPLLEHLILKLKASGCDHLVINIHHFGDKIMELLERKHSYGICIDISDEREALLDTGGGIAKALRFFPEGESVWVHNVDAVCNVDLNALNRVAAHCDLLLLVQRRVSSRMLYFDEKRLLRGWMNLRNGEQLSPYEDFNPSLLSAAAFSGIHLISGSVASSLREEKGAFPLIPYYIANAKRWKMEAVFPSPEFCWVDAGRVKSLPEAESIIEEYYHYNNK